MNTVQEILKTGLLTTTDLARILGVAERSVQRWEHGDVSPRWSTLEPLLEVKAVLDLAYELMGAEAGIWLRSPVPALDYDRPTVILRDRNYKRLIAALQAIGEGVTA